MESAARDLATAEDRDGLDASVMSAMAKEALGKFQLRKYGECLELLYQLLQKKEDDPKVLHNIAITDFFRDECSEPKKLLEALDKVKKKSNQLAQSSLELAETDSVSGTKGIAVSKGSTTSAQQLGVSSNSTILFSDEFDDSVATLNTAVVFFHLHEYGKALSVLEPLYNNIEPLDETVALHICLLILDAALACAAPKISADVLNYLEKAFGFCQSDRGSTAPQQSANLAEKSSTVANSSLINDASNLESSLVTSETPLSRTFSEETLDYESMLSELDIGGQNASRTPHMPSSNESSRIPMGKLVSAVDMKIKLQLYKVQFLLLTGNLKGAKREVKGTMNVVRGRDSSTALLLKAQLEYARGNFRKAMKLLMALGNRTEAGISGLFFNNLGCVYQQIKKYHSSSVLFAKALSSFWSSRKEKKATKLSSFSQDKSLYTIYNCGLQHLASGKPILAARCIQKAHPVFYDRPIFWFRLAECCIMAWEKGIIRMGNSSDCMKIYVIGKGKWRRIAVRNGLNDRYEEPVQENEISRAEDGHLKLSLEFARVCLLNAMHLLNRSGSTSLEDSSLPPEPGIDGLESTGSNIMTGADNKSPAVGLGQVPANGDVKEQKGLGTCEGVTSCSLSIYEDTLKRKMRVLRQAIFTNQAYVELELENPLDALSHASSLLQLLNCSKVYAYLGNLYAAEALCLLNRADEAAAHLSVYLVGVKEIELPYSEEDFKQWQTAKVFDYEDINSGASTTSTFSLNNVRNLQILKPEEARAALYVNLAVKSALEGEYESSLQLIVRALAVLPTSREAILTAVYIHLMMGSTQEALSKLKQLTYARFLPYSFTTHGSTSS